MIKSFLKIFSNAWKDKSLYIISRDFRDIEITKGDFVYV